MFHQAIIPVLLFFAIIRTHGNCGISGEGRMAIANRDDGTISLVDPDDLGLLDLQMPGSEPMYINHIRGNMWITER